MKENEKSYLRKDAEKLLKKKKYKAEAYTEAETLKLIHELEVHQKELELQNDELLHAKQIAELAEEKYIDLYDFAPSGYLSLSKEGRISVLNFTAAQMLGRVRSALINSYLVTFISQSTRDKFCIFFQNVFRDFEKTSCEVLLIVGNKSEMYIHLEGIQNKDRKECLLTLIDITAHKESERILIEKEKAEESDRLKTAFLQNISHEKRSPMNAIMGFSELLSLNFNNKDKIENFSKIIYQRCNDLLDIINNIVDIAKIESGQEIINLEVYDLNLLFNELNVYFKEQQKQTHKENVKLEFHIDCGTKISTIVTDKVKMRQIFLNLIKNAFKFTNDGIIEIGCKIINHEKIMFYVSDTGIGIPLDRQTLVFERFRQFHQGLVKNVGGTGLGLSIVKGLVTLLGGEIFLESIPGKGSTFSILFPFTTLKPQYYELEHI